MCDEFSIEDLPNDTLLEEIQRRLDENTTTQCVACYADIERERATNRQLMSEIDALQSRIIELEAMKQ